MKGIAINRGRIGWAVQWESGFESAMPDYETALKCAASGETLEACKRAVPIYKDAIDEAGGCDHKVGICCCSLIGEGDALLATIAKAEPSKEPVARPHEHSHC